MEASGERDSVIDSLYAATIIGELRRLVNETESHLTLGRQLAIIGSMQATAARAEDLADIARRSLHAELQDIACGESFPIDDP